MNYVVTYDILGLGLLALLYVLTYSITKVPSLTSKLYRLFIITAFTGTFLDVFTIWTNQYTSSFIMLFANWILAIIHILAVNSVPLVYYLFILALTHDDQKIPSSKKIFAGLFYGYDLITICSSPFTHLIIYYDKNGQYCHGSLFSGTYFIVILFILAGIIELFSHFKKITKKQFYLVLSYTVIDIFAAIYQFKNPQYLLVGFYTGISLIIISFVLKNPMELIDNNMGTYNRSAFKDYLYSRSGKNPLLIIHINNADSIKYKYGLDNGYLIIKKCISFLLKKCKQKVCFYVFRNTFIFPCKNQEDAITKANTIKKYKSESFSIKISTHTNINTEIKIDSNCFIITEAKLLKENFDEDERKSSLDKAIDILQFFVNPHETSSEIKSIDEEFIKMYKEKLKIQKIVDKAIANETFEVFLQPIYDLKKKRFTGAESLIRLRDPDGKFISPALFIPETEKNGKILELGDISIKKTCQFICDGKLQELGIEKVNINLSMVQCMQDNIAEHILELIRAYNIPEKMIRFEITETITTSNPEKLMNVMNKLTSHGIEFALDDYGTGYSNTSRLLTFPFSEIKFDKSFVDSAMESKRNQLPLKHLMNMVNDSDMIVLVEGIETKEMSELIESFGGTLIQGFYYAKPLPLQDFVDFIKNKK